MKTLFLVSKIVLKLNHIINWKKSFHKYLGSNEVKKWIHGTINEIQSCKERNIVNLRGLVMNFISIAQKLGVLMDKIRVWPTFMALTLIFNIVNHAFGNNI